MKHIQTLRQSYDLRLREFVYFSAGIVELTLTRSITDYGDTNFEKAMDLSLLREFERRLWTLDYFRDSEFRFSSLILSELTDRKSNYA